MYISIDLGGTKTRVASSNNLKEIVASEKFFSASTLVEQKNLVIAAIKSISADQSIDAICLGIPGIVDKVERVFKKVPNYKILEGQHYDVLTSPDYKSIPIYVENDAALAGLAEAVSGAGRSFNSVAYITLSTGVGGVKIENKITSISQKVFEPGHHIINMDSEYLDNAGVRGSMEAYLSGTAFEKIYGCKPQDCDDINVWMDYGKTLAVGMENIVAMWSPDIIVLGGSLTNKYDLFMDSLKKSLEQFGAFDMPPIVKALHGDDAGLIGGFEYISQNTTNPVYY